MRSVRAAVLVLALVPAWATAQAPAAADSAARHAAVVALVRAASEKNRLPANLESYKANVESEIGVILRQEDGLETVAAIEQVASTLRWTRTGKHEQHIVGSRSQQLGVSFSMLSVLRDDWLTAVLYGNRLRARVTNSEQARRARTPTRRDPDSVAIIHPLAVDREAYYVYSGGDTLVTLQSGDRRIPIARIHVAPRPDIGDSIAIFVGDMDLDVNRGTLVRLRGYFARAGQARHHGIGITIGDAIAFIEFENAEHSGTFWLPAVQRIELQAMLPVLGDGRAVVRIVSRFPDIAVNDTTLDSASLARTQVVRPYASRVLSYAPGDSLSHFASWHYPIGAITDGMHSDDFNDIAPDRMRPTGAPRLDIVAPRAADVVHFNRVEGLYLGLGGKLALRDKAPGVIVRGTAGWAFGEQTMRGRVSIERTRKDWGLTLRAGRSLDNTNDFRNPVDSGPFITFGSDDPYDYVSRKTVAIGARRFALQRRALVRFDLAAINDRYAATSVEHGLIGHGEFRANRGVDEGTYRRAIATLEWHPEVNAEGIRAGYTARAMYERGDGTLSYQRVELRTILRQLAGPFTWVARGDVGGVFGTSIPSQQLFELGKGQNLPGYTTKEFAGSRAAVLRTNVFYTSPFFRQPTRVTPRWMLPALAPGLGIGLQSGWTDAPTDAARSSILRLGVLPDSTGVLKPVSRTTDGIRATASVGLRFFSGSIFAGVARPIDHNAKWKFLLAGGRTL